jgi:hypothetical protein
MEWEDTKINGHMYAMVEFVKRSVPSDEEFFVEDFSRLGIVKKVFVFNKDTLTCAKELMQKKFNPLVVTSLVMDNYSDALEAMKTTKNIPLTMSVYLRSNLILCEPVHNSLGAITVFKDKKYEKIAPYEVSMLTIRPNKFPKLIGVGKTIEYENKSDSLYETIAGIFKIAYNRYNCIVFTDIGCDVGHPIELVVKYFNLCIQKYPIKYIIFAIPTDNFPYFNQHIFRFGGSAPK